MRTKNTKAKKRLTRKSGGIVSDKVGNYDNDPYFIKKNEEAKAYLTRVGLPKEFQTRNK